MKAIFLALFTLAATALATPVLTERQLETQADEIDRLTAVIQTHTANINKTTAAAPENPSLAEQNAAAAALAPDFNAITQALTTSTVLVFKRGLEGLSASGKCDKDCLLVKVQFLVWEIACTLKFVIIKLGLACVLVYLTPLILALVALVKSLDKVVVGLLIAVKGLLTAVLGTVAGALLALIIW